MGAGRHKVSHPCGTIDVIAEEYVTRAVVFPLDLSPSQERLALSYTGARRFAYNWAIRSVSENLATRSAERAAGMAEPELTPALSWSAYGLNRAFNSVKDVVAPWWRLGGALVAPWLHACLPLRNIRRGRGFGQLRRFEEGRPSRQEGGFP